MEVNGSHCGKHVNGSNNTDTNCSLVYNVCRDLILETGLTTEACLAGNTSTVSHHDDDDDDDISDGEG